MVGNTEVIIISPRARKRVIGNFEANLPINPTLQEMQSAP